jgi:hypothetical protein
LSNSKELSVTLDGTPESRTAPPTSRLPSWREKASWDDVVIGEGDAWTMEIDARFVVADNAGRSCI